MSASNSMTPAERRASFGLAGIYGLRMLGLFIILPVFALYAEHLRGGNSHLLMGIALGAYGLTQAILQIPAGWLSDRIGRKPVIYLSLLLFALGSFIAAYADDIYWVIVGRVVQGAGALNAAVMALTADLTREEVRTKAMALIGITIGATFSLSLILSPLLNGVLGVPGIFAMTGVLALLALPVVRFVIPDPTITRFHTDTESSSQRFGEVLRNKDLLRLDFGIFSLSAILMSIFMQVPFLLQSNGLDVSQHWHVYLPVMLASFVLMVPFIIAAGKSTRMKPVFMLAIALALCAQLLLMYAQHSLWFIGAALLIFFTAFNVLEAKLPSLISVTAPLASKGTAMGVYSSVQFLGAFFGATAGGALMQYVGGNAVFLFSIGLLLLWLIVASGMQQPEAVRTKLYHLPETTDAAAAVELQNRLAQQKGVREVIVVAAEQMVCIKANLQEFDETAVKQLIAKGV
ncbi:MAG: MFS transporter [Gallionella sp.]|nr:MFS transporter [Gallionella sp.]